MATYISNLTNGQIDEKGFLRLFGTILSASGVIQSGGMAVAAQSTPDMTVKVAGGATGHDIVFITTAGDTYHGWNTTDVNVTITANSSGVIKTDAIVAYADLAGGLATSNNPNALKFVAVRRSGTNTGAPTSGEIGTAVSSNPYVVLAHVTVSNGASSINSGNLSDQRVRAVLGTNVVPTAAIQDNAVTTGKIAPNSIGGLVLSNAQWTTASVRTIGPGGSGVWPGTGGISFTSSGGILMISLHANGINISGGTGQLGVVIDGALAGGWFSNYFNASPNYSGGTVILPSVAAGTHTIQPGGWSNGPGNLTWNAFNAMSASILEIKK